MTPKVPNEDGPTGPKRHILATFAAVSAVPIVLGFLVWLDNQAGFRDAGAFADLLASIFGMISVVWLIAAVLLQREELMLQRLELGLQRLEVGRLADETNRQASLMNEQLALQRKESLTAEFKAFLLSEGDRMIELRKEIEKVIDDKAKERLGLPDASIKWRYFGRKRIRIVLQSGEQKLETTVRYAEVAFLIEDNPRLRRGHNFWQRCRIVGLGPWFRRYLPHAVGPIAGLSVYQITAFTNVAARARRRIVD